MSYRHTQYGPWHWLIHLNVVLVLVLAYLLREHRVGAYCLAGVAGLLLTAAFSFRWLRVSDEGESLRVRFGPLPLFGKRFPYATMTDIQRDRTRLIDGWGIHYIPRRGWTYNIWGYDCVRFQLGDRVYRIGTNDAENLARILSDKGGGTL